MNLPVPFPLQETLLCRYVSYLASQGLKHKTIKAYLSGLRFTQIHLNMGNPFKTADMPQLDYVLTGIKRVQAKQQLQPKPRLPITMDIMRSLKSSWVQTHPCQDNTMLWAAACTGFFGFLRVGEFTVPSEALYDPEVHLNLADISINSRTEPSLFCIRIKQSKTDPFRMGVDIFLGATQADVCPVQALVNYLKVRSPAPGPLFTCASGAPLTRRLLVNRLHAALHQDGRAAKDFNGHSFRIGAATTAARCGLEDSLIQTLGRWKSAAYLAYIKIPRDQLAATAARLAKDTPL